MRYLRGSPHRTRSTLECQIDRVEGVKTFRSGHIAVGDDITVQVEGVFQTSVAAGAPLLASP